MRETESLSDGIHVKGLLIDIEENSTCAEKGATRKPVSARFYFYAPSRKYSRKVLSAAASVLARERFGLLVYPLTRPEDTPTHPSLTAHTLSLDCLNLSLVGYSLDRLLSHPTQPLYHSHFVETVVRNS